MMAVLGFVFCVLVLLFVSAAVGFGCYVELTIKRKRGMLVRVIFTGLALLLGYCWYLLFYYAPFTATTL